MINLSWRVIAIILFDLGLTELRFNRICDVPVTAVLIVYQSNLVVGPAMVQVLFILNGAKTLNEQEGSGIALLVRAVGFIITGLAKS